MTDYDRAMLQCATEVRVPVHVLLTKADKLKRGQAAAAVHEVQRDLAGRATVQAFSATTRLGEDQARQTLADFLHSPRGA
jgi:GTP-binding protein